MKMYEEYKDSGVKWIGEVPSHWKIAPIKRFLSGMQDGTHGTYQTVDSGYPLLSAKNVFDTGLCIEDAERKISKDDYYSIIANGYPQKGDIALCCVGTIGRCCIYNEDVPYAFQRSVTFLRCNEAGYNSFFLYCLKSQVANTQYRMYEKTSAQSGIYMGVLKTLIFPIPTFIEQHHIAAYLDAKTEKIDKMIAKAEKKIEYFGELKQSLITRAVTRGLNPNAPLKDSGVKWIGDIPRDWEIPRLNFVTSKIGSGSTPKGGSEVYVDEGVVFLRSQNVYNDGLRLNDVVHIVLSIHEQMKGTKVQVDDILFNITGASIGRCCRFTKGIGEANVNQHVCIVRPKNILPTFLMYCLQSFVGQTQLRQLLKGGNREGLSGESFKNFYVLLPSPNEQQQIATYLDIKCSKIDHIVATQKKKIAYLQELKQSLITNVVTGKIKVS